MAADVVVFTDAGADANVVSVATAAILKYIDWGTGATGADPANTAMQTAGAESRATGTISHVVDREYKVVGTMTCNATGKAITEAGLFDASTGPTMWIRATFDAINVVQNDTIQFTFTLTFT